MAEVTAERKRGHSEEKEQEAEENCKAPVKKGKTDDGLGTIVAAHYNGVKQVGINERKDSRIFYLRNVNNWMKSQLIGEQLDLLKEDVEKNLKSTRKLRVLDLCCGKGGDIKKWVNGPVGHVIFVDIAETSVQQCSERYKTLSSRQKSFSAQFITADCTKARIREKFDDVTATLDLVSCQFAFHYCFESLPQAEVMLKNASECLRPGGRFVGSIPNASEIVRRLKENNGSCGNELYSISTQLEEPYPHFGAKYDFNLDGVVNCPEFLVHFPTLVKLARKFGLKLVSVTNFPEFFENMKDKGKRLMNVMQALETYPAPEGKQLVGRPEQYSHVKEQKESRHVGTLSAPEWEVVSLYVVFIFEKVSSSSWDENGKPVYKFD